MEKTARLIIGFNCPRKCGYCLNQYEHIIGGAVEINELKELRDYPVVVITGGEPGIMEQRVLNAISILKMFNPEQLIYMYSAWYRNRWGRKLLDYLDGVHYTLHKGATEKDISDFQEFQMHAALLWPDKSYRLYIHDSIKHGITIYPHVWHRLEVKPWIADEDCALPPNEDLFVWTATN